MKPKIFGLALLMVGIALCGFGLSWLLRPNQYMATTRIRSESGWGDMPQTTFEIMRSQLVLGAVITNMNLNVVWGRKYFHGATLTPKETMAFAQSRMSFALVFHPQLVEITFHSDDPKEAAQVANAIAKAYQELHVKWRKDGVASQERVFQEQESQIAILATYVEELRQKFGIQHNASTNQSPEQQSYWDEKRKLDQLLELHALIYSNLEAEKVDLIGPAPLEVQITDPAEPPKSPVGPNGPLGAALLAVGLFPLLGLILLLKSKP